MRALFVLGTRPEVIKLAPIILEIRESKPEWQAMICATGQHDELLDQAFTVFSLEPDWNLRVMTPGQSLAGATARVMAAIDPVLVEAKPDVVFVQGDTLTTFCGALAAFYRRLPVVHVEAGLRTGNLAEPFPEELNRVLASRIATLHCAATQDGVENLLAEGVPSESVVLTGNTGIDAVRIISERLDRGQLTGYSGAPSDRTETAEKRLIVVTAHRRENFGIPLKNICNALKYMASWPDVCIVFPVHPNPAVRETVFSMLNDTGVRLTDPVGYSEMVDLIRRAWLVITDSGGLQEEAPFFGKPVLVLRDSTERPEGVRAGNAKLVGTDIETIVAEAARLKHDQALYSRMSQASMVYGDGRASGRILTAVSRMCSIPYDVESHTGTSAVSSLSAAPGKLK